MARPDAISTDRRGWRGGTCIPALVIFLLGLSANAGDFEKGNELYDEGRFAEAKQHYEQLLESGTRSANLFHNLANTDYRIGSPGRAILGYERALLLEPSHPEAFANLKLLRDQTHARDLDRPVHERLLLRVRENVWTVVAALAGWGAIFCLVLVFTTEQRERSGLWLGAGAAVLVAVLAGFGISLHVRDRNLAIVTAKEVEAHLAPAESAALAGILPAGSRVRVLSERGHWIYCELPDARRGWLAAGTIERVRPMQS